VPARDHGLVVRDVDGAARDYENGCAASRDRELLRLERESDRRRWRRMRPRDRWVIRAGRLVRWAIRRAREWGWLANPRVARRAARLMRWACRVEFGSE
jgi:hypothetical protein